MEEVLPKYSVLESIRHPSKRANDLINAISARFGEQICWSKERLNYIDLGANKSCIFFRFHGNKYTKRIELLSLDIEILQQVKLAFPGEFLGEVKIEEGLL